MSNVIGHTVSPETRRKISLAHIGMKHTEATKKKISEIQKGKPCPPGTLANLRKLARENTGKKRPPYSEEWKKNMSLAAKGRIIPDEVKAKISETNKKTNAIQRLKDHIKIHGPSMKGKKWSAETRAKLTGPNSSNWKGGITPEKLRVRMTVEYKLFVDSVFARDGYTCQKYGTVGGKLEAHHILNFSSHPELRFAIDNGVTLSKKAHREFHRKYGTRNNTLEQLNEFLYG